MNEQAQPFLLTKGQRVAVINCTMSGKFIMEGHATVTSILRNGPHEYRARVRFDGVRGTFARFIDPAAQADPQAFCDTLNAERERGARS